MVLPAERGNLKAAPKISVDRSPGMYYFIHNRGAGVVQW